MGSIVSIDNVVKEYNLGKVVVPALRGVSQRQGDAKTPYGRIQNLGRMRVVVKP